MFDHKAGKHYHLKGDFLRAFRRRSIIQKWLDQEATFVNNARNAPLRYMKDAF